jgi:hypothetical protein
VGVKKMGMLRTRKIINLLLLLNGIALPVFPIGVFDQADEVVRTQFGLMLKETYNIDSFIVSEGPSMGGYVLTKENKIIFATGLLLFEYDPLTEERKEIEGPLELENSGGPKDMTYNERTNSIHMLIGQRVIASTIKNLYYVLHLDDYTWEMIPELCEPIQIYKYHYSILGNIIYINRMFMETRKSGQRRRDELLVFDMGKREFVGKICFPEEVVAANICAMYGDLLQILAKVYFENDPCVYYPAFNLEVQHLAL